MKRRCVVRIGTDCSGTDAPIYGIQQSKLHRRRRIKVAHRWSCDVSSAAQKFITLNHRPERLYTDMVRRKHRQLPPVDSYVCGFPCQNWSTLGKRQGWSDHRSRVYRALLRTLRKGRIRSFILENVATLAQHRGGRTLKLIMRQLQQTGYRVDAKIYNAVEFGLPQKRRRLYIVGLHKDEHIQPELPDPPSVELPLLSSFLDEDYGALRARPGKRQGTARRNLKQFQQVMEENGIDGDQETWVVDVDASKRFVSAEHEICPTLTYSRASGFWLTSRRRRMNTAEMWRLQGFPVEEITPLASARMMGQLAGNNMCVPILTHIFDYLLPCLFDFN